MKGKHFRFLVRNFSTKSVGNMRASLYPNRFTINKHGVVIDLPFLLAQDILLNEKKELYTDARTIFDVNLKTVFEKANNLLNTNKFTFAATEFEKLIASLINEEVDNLTSFQKEILTESCIKLSKIYRIGSSEEGKKALQLAQLASEISPASEETTNLVSSILVEYAPYPEESAYDESMNEDPLPSKKV